jgi:2,3-dihydroxy-2,3-dihydrophenylpropionate dehydrogenase
MTGPTRHVLITGGASGIGAEVARAFLAEGARVTVLDRVASPDPEVHSCVGDVRSASDQADAVGVAAPDGVLDVLVANAGVHDGGLGLRDAGLDEIAETMRSVLEINVLGYLLSLKAAEPALRQARGCAVLTLSDASFDVRGNRAGVAYATSKHAGLGLLRAAARDLAPEVRVNAVAPGGVATGLSVEHDDGPRRLIDDPAALAERVGARTLLGRGATLAEMAAVYTFLASPGAGGTTGQVLRVDGGLLS